MDKNRMMLRVLIQICQSNNDVVIEAIVSKRFVGGVLGYEAFVKNMCNRMSFWCFSVQGSFFYICLSFIAFSQRQKCFNVNSIGATHYL